MEGSWNVNYGGKTVGSCQVVREGLYYRFCCRCDGKLDDVSSLLIQCGECRVPLGILVPLDRGFGLNTKVAAKRFPPGTPEFTVSPKNEPLDGEFVAVREDQPFAYLARLEGARLARYEGKLGVILK